MTLDEFIQQQYGIRTDTVKSTFTVGTTPVQIVQNNPNRISYTVVNASTNAIFTDENPSVSVNNGAIVGGGSSQAFDWRVDGQTAGYGLYAVSASAGCQVYVREVVIIDSEEIVP